MTSARTATNKTAPSKIDVWLILALLLALYAPTYQTLDKLVWARDGQGHGPVMLALIGWLLWQRLPNFLALPPRSAPLPAFVSLLVGATLYVLGRSQELMMFDAASHIFVLGAIALHYRGWVGLKTIWFPLFFFIFVIPIPPSIVDVVTAPLKLAVSHVAENLLAALNYPIGREGVILFIGPYRLLVADACAGINSIFALEAVGVFYMSVAAHQNRLRNILLATFILPISFISNVVRVCTLVLVTYYFGDEAGQGFVHGFAGIVLFMVATALTITFDGVLALFFNKNHPSQLKPKQENSEPAATDQSAARTASPFALALIPIFATLIWAGYALQPSMTGVVINQAQLEALIPTKFGDWQEVKSIAPLVSAARPGEPSFDQPYDAQVMRTYRNSANQLVMLAVAYGNNQRQDIKVHRPEVCYQAQGWQVNNLTPNSFPLTSSTGNTVTGMQMTATEKRAGSTEAVSYWVRIGNTFTQNGLGQRIHIFMQGIKGHRSDGVLVRFSQHLKSNEPTEPSYQLQAQFAKDLLTSMSPEARHLLTH